MINMLVSESKYLKNKNLNIKKDNRPHTIPKKVKSWFNTISKKKKKDLVALQGTSLMSFKSPFLDFPKKSLGVFSSN